MADQKISELTEKTTPAGDDLLAIVDSEASPIQTKKIKHSNLKTGFASKVRAYISANFTLANNTWTKVALNAKTFDGLGEFDSTTNYRFTAQAAGYYLVMGRTQCNGNSVDQQSVGVAIYKNGSFYDYTEVIAPAANKYIASQFLQVISLAATDYLELYAWQTSGGNQVMSGNWTATVLVVSRLS